MWLRKVNENTGNIQQRNEKRDDQGQGKKCDSSRRGDGNANNKDSKRRLWKQEVAERISEPKNLLNSNKELKTKS